MYIHFITTKRWPVPTPTPLAWKHEPGVALLTTTTTPPSSLANASRRWGFLFSSLITHPPRLQTRAGGSFTHHHHHPTPGWSRTARNRRTIRTRVFLIFISPPKRAYEPSYACFFSFSFFCSRHVYEQLYTCFLGFISFSIL